MDGLKLSVSDPQRAHGHTSIDIRKENYTIINDEMKEFAKRILKLGDGNEHPEDGSKARVSLHLLSNMTIDESELGEYKLGGFADVVVGEGDTELSQLFDRVVQTMKRGEWCYIKTTYASQDQKTTKDHTTPSSVSSLDKEFVGLAFNITLESFSHVERQLCGTLELAEHHKAAGNDHIKAGRFDRSCRRFRKALSLMDAFDASALPADASESAKRLVVACHLNLALGYLKQKDFEMAVQASSAALELEPDSVKGLYRRGQAYSELQRYDEAKRDLSRALQIDPSNKAVANSLQHARKFHQRETEVFRNMFAK